MNGRGSLSFFAVGLIVALSPSALAKAAATKAPTASLPVAPIQPELPVWFVGHDRHGLWESGDGSLGYGSARMPAIAHSGHLAAAAYYPAHKVIVVATRNATITSYAIDQGTLSKRGSYAPNFLAAFNSIHFTTLPDLVFEDIVDVKLDRTLHPPAVAPSKRLGASTAGWASLELQPYVKSLQLISIHTHRITLGPGAAGWQGVALTSSASPMLGGIYRATGKRLEMRLGTAPPVVLALPKAVDTLKMNNPALEENQLIAVLPGRAILYQAGDVLALYDLHGKLQKAFPAGYVHAPEWGRPVYRKGNYYVFAEWPLMGSSTYKLDITHGRLICVRSDM